MANQNGWNTVGVVETKKENKPAQPQEDKLDFLATPEGDTKVRIMDEAPFFYQGYWSVSGNGAKDGNGNGCFVPYKGKGKDLLEKANQEFMTKVFKAADEKGLKNGSKERKKFLKDNGYDKQPYGKLKSKYIIHVIDRADGQLKLLDAGAGIFEELKKYAMNEEYGDLRKYDVTITRTGTGWMDTEYGVTPARNNTPLDDKERELYEEKKIDREKLKGGEGLTPEQCLFIAEGGLWSDLPQDRDDSPREEYQVGLPDAIPDTQGEIQVDTSKEGALSDEELANVNF